MLKSYLFVPAHNPKFLKKSLQLKNLDYRILDFEDSVSASNIENAIQTVRESKLRNSDWVRIPVDNRLQEIASPLFKLGLQNIIVPKIKNKKHFEVVLNQLQEMNSDVTVILLIENALTYLQLEDILEKWNQNIWGIGLGSHDFSAATKIKHNTKELFPLRLQVSLLANAYDVTSIDIASMNISDQNEYNEEIQDAYDLGYRAKFVLHPFQLKLLQDYPFFSKKEVEDASHVLKLFNEQEEIQEVVLKYKGKIYEKPHVENLKQIKAWGEQFYGTNR